MESMLKVAITGNIASGKSTAEGFLKEKNLQVLDTDEVAHSLLCEESVKTQILASFSGHDILEGEGLSRAKIGKIIFADGEQRRQLEDILHPLIKEKIARFFSTARAQGEKIVFVSVPLLFEAGFEELFDSVILIYAPDGTRLQRLMRRSNLTQEQAQNRLRIQQSQDEKKLLADYVIYNDSDLAALKNRTQIVLSRICASI